METKEFLRQIIGPESQIGYIVGIMFDPAHREIYAVNNDLDDRIVVFDDDARGDVKPKRRLYVPHQAWGLSLNPAADQFAISVQQLSMVAFYRREASGLEAPLRIIAGPKTGLLFIVGVAVDPVHDRIVAASASSVRGGTTGLFILSNRSGRCRAARNHCRTAHRNCSTVAARARPRAG